MIVVVVVMMMMMMMMIRRYILRVKVRGGKVITHAHQQNKATGACVWEEGRRPFPPSLPSFLGRHGNAHTQVSSGDRKETPVPIQVKSLIYLQEIF